jgi:minor histocompatibility antigen H13
MTKVAVNLDGPVKMVYRIRESDSVLGLGDIVLPGLFLSVCSRFDTFLRKLLKRRTPYWIVGMIGYTAAMILTDVVCHLTHSGQPALLFIVPCLTVPIVLLAFLRKEHYAFMSFSG